MEQIEWEATQRQADFHAREVLEGPTRNPAMPEQQLEIHKEQLKHHLGKLATETEL